MANNVFCIPVHSYHIVPIFEFDYDGHICSLENFSMSLWTPYKGVLGWLKFVPGAVQETQKLEPLRKWDKWLQVQNIKPLWFP